MYYELLDDDRAVIVRELYEDIEDDRERLYKSYFMLCLACNLGGWIDIDDIIRYPDDFWEANKDTFSPGIYASDMELTMNAIMVADDIMEKDEEVRELLIFSEVEIQDIQFNLAP